MPIFWNGRITFLVHTRTTDPSLHLTISYFSSHAITVALHGATWRVTNFLMFNVLVLGDSVQGAIMRKLRILSRFETPSAT